MRFLENTDLLKIEDILPFFPDFVVIDDFKEEICTALEGYSAHIDALKADMDEATKNAEAIKQDIAALQKRFVTVDATEKCSSCALALMTRQFYVFPCHHTFHADCLIGLVSAPPVPAPGGQIVPADRSSPSRVPGRPRLSDIACLHIGCFAFAAVHRRRSSSLRTRCGAYWPCRRSS